MIDYLILFIHSIIFGEIFIQTIFIRFYSFWQISIINVWGSIQIKKSSNEPPYSIQRQWFIKTIIFWTNYLSNTPCCNSHCTTLFLFFTLLPFHWIISSERLLASSLQNDRWHLLQKLNLFKERWFCKSSFENVFSIQICYILVKIELSFERLQYVYEEKRLHLLQMGCHLAILHVGAEALLLCRQLHKRAINNLWPRAIIGLSKTPMDLGLFA